MSEPYQDTLGLWEMNDDELEAELQRQLDGLDSEDDQDVKEEERQLIQTGTNNKIVTAEEEGEGTEVDENKSLTANISPAPDSAWSQLMATMNADTNHWDQYEQGLADLRTSIASVVPRSEEINVDEGVPNSPQSPSSSNLSMVGIPLPDPEDSKEENSDNEEEQSLMMNIEDPESYVEEIQKRLQTLLEEEEKEEKAEGERKKVREDTLLQNNSNVSFSDDTDKIKEEGTSTVATDNVNDEHIQTFKLNRKANDIVRQFSLNEERECSPASEEHEKELEMEIVSQQEYRQKMEEELKLEREALQKQQEERRKKIEMEAIERQKEIELEAKKKED
jgi:hypothetical protein